MPRGATRARQGAKARSPEGEPLHVILELSDHLGSTSLSIDRATSELTSRSSYQAYGASEADYRPTRWNSFREDYKFTGKEEDAEIGLTYFGKRYLNAYLGRWISADPLAIHAPGEADLNVYAYVSGAVLKNVDPLGLDKVMITDSVSAKFAEQWKNSVHEKLADGRVIRSDLVAGERHVVRVSDDASADQMKAKMREAAEMAGDAGKVILSVGHGGVASDDEPESSTFVDLAPGQTPDAHPLRVEANELHFARQEGKRQPSGAIARQTGTQATDLLQEYGTILKEQGVATLEFLTCKAGSDKQFTQDVADHAGLTVQSHKHKVAFGSDGKQATAYHVKDGTRDTSLPGDTSTNMTPAVEQTAQPSQESNGGEKR